MSGVAGCSCYCAKCSSLTVVVQNVRGRWACDTGDRTQILVDGFEVTVSHVVIDGPRHDLKKIGVERLRNAAGVDRASRTSWMGVIHIHAGSEDLFEFGERVASFRAPGLIRSQVARDDVRRTRDERAEVPAPAQIGRRIDLFRLV